MAPCVLLRLANDRATYLVDLAAGSVSKVDATAELGPEQGQEIRGVDVAIVSERREAAATFPAFTD